MGVSANVAARARDALAASALDADAAHALVEVVGGEGAGSRGEADTAESARLIVEILAAALAGRLDCGRALTFVAAGDEADLVGAAVVSGAADVGGRGIARGGRVTRASAASEGEK